MRAWGPSTCPAACVLAGRRCALWGWRKGVPGGGAFRRCEGRLRSGAPPPPTAHPPGGLSGSATHVLWARVCGCGGPALAPWLACPVGGCAPRGWWGASGFRRPPFPGCPPPGRAAGARWPRAVGAGVGVCGVSGFCAVRAMSRGVALRLSLWCPPLRCFVAVLCSPCACRATFPARVPCSAAGYLLFLLWFRRSLPFPLLTVGSPSSLACTFSLPPPWCVSRSFSLPASLVPVPGSSSFSPVQSCETGEGWGCVGLRAAARYSYNVTYFGLFLYQRGCHYRCVLRCVACNIPVSALVFTCVRTLFTLLVIPWCLSVAVSVVLCLR